MTNGELRKALAAVGVTVRVDEAGDYRVNFRGGREATAYYTSDRDDALLTGLDMAARGAERAVAVGALWAHRAAR